MEETRIRHNSGVSLISTSTSDSVPDPHQVKVHGNFSLLSKVILIFLILCAASLLILLLIRIEKAQDEILKNHEDIVRLAIKLESVKSMASEKQPAPSPAYLKGVLPEKLTAFQQNDRELHSPTKTKGTKGQRDIHVTPSSTAMLGMKLGSTRKEVIHVVGKGNSYNEIHPGEPIHHWKIGVRSGLIALDIGTHICIKITGLYFTYSQIQFVWPEHRKRATRSVVYTVTRNRDDAILKSVVPLKNCVTTCTRYHGRLVKLNKGDKISVRVMQKVQIITRASVTYFGAFLLTPL